VFEVSRHYQAWHEARLAAEAASAAPRGGGRYGVESVRINGLGEQEAVVVGAGSSLEQDVVLYSRDGEAPVFLNGIVRNDGTPVYGVSSEMAGVQPQPLPEQRFRYRLRFPALALLPGRYTLRSHALDPTGLSLHDTVDREFEVVGVARDYGLVRLQHEWLS
jgi:lipopolysaccharide transport system ATP-binding protein